MDRLRVVTLNLWNKRGPWAARLPLVVKELERLRPDVVALQEVLRHDALGECQGREVVAALDGALGGTPALAFGPACERGAGLVMGNAILSRFPIRESGHVALPFERADDGRAATWARIDTPFGVLPFFSTHLSWQYHEGYLRLRQVRALVRAVTALAPIDGALPPVVCGDFNAEPDADEIRFLRGLAVVDGESAYFADAYAWRGAPPGHTWDPRNRFTAPDLGPPRRIDYVFVRGPDRDGRGRVLSARLCFDTAVGEVFPSDHFGVEAELQASPD